MELMPSALGASRIIVALPPLDAARLVAVGEVLWQTGLRAWSVGSTTALGTLSPVFGRRAAIGVHDVIDALGAKAAQAGGAHFVGTPYSAPFAGVGIPAVLGALSADELRGAAAAKPAAVQIPLASSLDTAYTQLATRILGQTPLIGSGNFDIDFAADWLAHGAAGIWLRLTFDDAVNNPDLEELRVLGKFWGELAH
ncbi:MAG: hypothetical protein LBU38_05510 [Propionibacteriaceae bacterium]|jgi:2-keto-3-deoxy-6-phosphogluconate aldolase|nr:hypothetical protein [Propionibacteriaceae bacterium]